MSLKRRRLKVLIVAGARPNFVKIAPLLKEFKSQSNFFDTRLVHTGQHYDFKMSSVFFRDLSIPKPDIYLKVGSGTHAEQLAKIMTAFENLLMANRPDLVVVVGDVNSTLACSLAASKLGVRVAHAEAGLRSFDRAMPEEINRLATDRLSDFLFVTEASGVRNLKREGVSASKIFFVGNLMIDCLLANLKKIRRSKASRRLGVHGAPYGMLTLHRPSNVDSKEPLKKIFHLLTKACQRSKLVYPVHPRTRAMIKRYGLEKNFNRISGLIMTEPLGYIDFMSLVADASFVLTDSGGVQEESTVLGVPCLTMRENTERPVTISHGTNTLVGLDSKKILSGIKRAIDHPQKKATPPRLWDGRSARRIVDILRRHLR